MRDDRLWAVPPAKNQLRTVVRDAVDDDGWSPWIQRLIDRAESFDLTLVPVGPPVGWELRGPDGKVIQSGHIDKGIEATLRNWKG